MHFESPNLVPEGGLLSMASGNHCIRGVSSTRSLPFIEEAEPAIPGSRSCALSFVFFIVLRGFRFPRGGCGCAFAGGLVVGAGAPVRGGHRGRWIRRRNPRIGFRLAGRSAVL